MKYFLKLNFVSILYALIIVVPIELMINVLRISRITGLDIHSVERYSIIAVIIGTVIATIILYYLTKKWLKKRRANFWTVLLWFPYFVLMIYLVAVSFPVTYGGDDPGPGAGIIIMGLTMVFPIYILMMNLASYLSGDNT